TVELAAASSPVCPPPPSDGLPLPPIWGGPPISLDPQAPGPVVCVGERVLLSASAADTDTVTVKCLGGCGRAEMDASFPDEVNYMWTGPAGSFPDYGGDGSQAVSNGKSTRVGYKAPETPGNSI